MEKVILNTDQLDQLALHHPTLASFYEGALPCDSLPPPDKVSHPRGMIVNTDPASMGGRHWLGVWIDGNTCEIFDSFALDLELYETTAPLIKWLKQFKYVTRNGRCVQSIYDQSCGGYALMFLVAKSQGEKMSQFEKNFFKTNYVMNDKKVGRFVRDLIGKERRWQKESLLKDMVDGKPVKIIQGTARSRGGVRHLIH